MDRLFTMLEQRRRELGMSYSALARRAGVSQPTVVRLLHGRNYQTGFAAVFAVARTLGVNLDAPEAVPVDAVAESEARRKARLVARAVQGTSQLEAQGLAPADLERLEARSAARLLAGSRRNLWAG